MKILYLANLRLPTEKAYGIQIAKMCEAFAALKFKIKNEKLKVDEGDKIEVELVAPTRQNKIKEDLFDYYSIKRNFRFKRIWAPDFYLPGKLDKITVNIKNFISAAFLCLYALTHKADVIYTRDELVVYFLSFFKKNIIFECHRFSDKKKRLYHHFQKIIAISDGLKEDLVKSGVKGENILVARDGVDLDFFHSSLEKYKSRDELNLPKDKKIILYSGHLFKWKGVNTLLQVARILKDNILFIFVGGTEYDLVEFKDNARGLDNVLILGHKSYAEIPKLLSSADILVLPNSAKDVISSRYTSPLKLFEYMAARKPIIASDTPSLREILNEENSVLVSPDNPVALADAISNLITNEVLGEKIAAKAFDDVQKYTWQKRAADILDFIR